MAPLTIRTCNLKRRQPIIYLIEIIIYYFLEQEKQVFPTKGADKEGSKEPADRQDTYSRSESLADFCEDTEAASDSDSSISKLVGCPDGHFESGMGHHFMMRIN